MDFTKEKSESKISLLKYGRVESFYPSGPICCFPRHSFGYLSSLFPSTAAHLPMGLPAPQSNHRTWRWVACANNSLRSQLLVHLSGRRHCFPCHCFDSYILSDPPLPRYCPGRCISTFPHSMGHDGWLLWLGLTVGIVDDTKIPLPCSPALIFLNFFDHCGSYDPPVDPLSCRGH